MRPSRLTLNDAVALARDTLAALRRDERAKKPLWPAPYDALTPEAAYKWLTECWWTLNEADGGVIELVPAMPFVQAFCDEWVRAFTTRTPAVFEKSRRLVVSWMARGLETWVMGLARGDWLLVDQTDENAGEHLWRVHFSLTELYERRPELNLQPHEARGAIKVKNVSHVLLANGSLLGQSHQDAGTAQGKGKTGVTFEELSKYSAPSTFWNQALTVTIGKAKPLDGVDEAAGIGRSGGWVNAIANATTNPDWHDVKPDGFDEEGLPRHVRAVEVLANPAYRLMEGMAARDLETGTRYVVIHYTADEGKRGDWALRESKKMAGGITGRDWRREMELQEEGYEGKPVYETYDDDVHCPVAFRTARVPVLPRSIFVACWDCGSTMRPGFVLLMITQKPYPVQVVQLLEVVSTGNEPMSLFAPRVMAAVTARIGPSNAMSVKHVGDGTIRNRQGNNGDSAADVALRISGIKIEPMSNIEQVRQSAVTELLVQQVKHPNGAVAAMFILDGCCTMTRGGFLGGYRFAKMKTQDGSIRWKPHPEKNEFSEPHDALQYGAQKVWTLIRKSLK